MLDKTHQKRFVAELEALSPSQTDAWSRATFGFPYAVADRIARIGATYSRGESPTPADIKFLKGCYPNVPGHTIDKIHAEIVALPPHFRGEAFAAHVTGEMPGGPMATEMKGIIDNVSQVEIVEGIKQKRAENAPRDSEGRPIPTIRPKEDPMSTRALLEQQMGVTAARQRAEQVQTDEVAEMEHRYRLADRLEAADATLKDESAGLRDHLDAAFEQHAISDHAEDFGFIPPEQP